MNAEPNNPEKTPEDDAPREVVVEEGKERPRAGSALRLLALYLPLPAGLLVCALFWQAILGRSLALYLVAGSIAVAGLVALAIMAMVPGPREIEQESTPGRGKGDQAPDA